MTQKEIINQGRKRKHPEGFGWVDHRLARENLISKFSSDALALYLFLITVGDEDGVSWYSDDTVCRKLNFSGEKLKAARGELSCGQLIAHRKPHYQVLELPRAAGDDRFRNALAAAAETSAAEERRQPAGTEGLGVSLQPPGGIFRRCETVCDALPLAAIISAMAGGTK